MHPYMCEKLSVYPHLYTIIYDLNSGHEVLSAIQIYPLIAVRYSSNSLIWNEGNVPRLQQKQFEHSGGESADGKVADSEQKCSGFQSWWRKD